MDSEPQRGLNSDPGIQLCPTLSLPLPTVSISVPTESPPLQALETESWGSQRLDWEIGRLGSSPISGGHTQRILPPLWTSVCVSVCSLTQSRPTLCYLARLLCPWDFSVQNTALHCHFLLQGIFPTQGSNLHLSHWQENWQANSLPLSHLGSPQTSVYLPEITDGGSPMPWTLPILTVSSSYLHLLID